MQAGRLRHTVAIERQTQETDNYGETQDVWCLYAMRRASIEPINGREYFTSSGEHAEITTRIRLRYDKQLSALRPMDRVKHEGAIYDVVSVINPQERNREIVLMAKRGYQDGC